MYRGAARLARSSENKNNLGLQRLHDSTPWITELPSTPQPLPLWQRKPHNSQEGQLTLSFIFSSNIGPLSHGQILESFSMCLSIDSVYAVPLFVLIKAGQHQLLFHHSVLHMLIEPNTLLLTGLNVSVQIYQVSPGLGIINGNWHLQHIWPRC